MAGKASSGIRSAAQAGLIAWATLSGAGCSSDDPSTFPGATTAPGAGTTSMASTGAVGLTSGATGATTAGTTATETTGGTAATTMAPTTGASGVGTTANAGGVSSGTTTAAPEDAGGTTGTTGMPPRDPSACDASAAPALSVLGLETVVTDARLQSLVYAAQPPGAAGVWFLVELTGKVWVYADGALRDTPFLDLSADVQRNDFYDERGILGFTFAPDWAESHKAYVALVPTTGDNANHDLLLEYAGSAADPYVADVSTRRAVVDLPPAGQAGFGWNNYHNGNTPMFGPDGMLYFGIGDGGGECNGANPGAPQDPSMPYGKILRLDPSAPAPHAAAGNPFAGMGDDRVYHLGLRNPFRFSFDSATGDLYIGDVGQWNYEEVDVAPSGMAGLNFGWPDFEAMDTSTCPEGASMRAGDTHTEPVHVIPHGNNGGAAALVMTVVGGAVYRGSAIPELYGTYLFGEYYASRPMAAMTYCNGAASPAVEVLKNCDPNTPNQACFRSDGAPLAEVAAVIEGLDHELYLPANGNTLFKVVAAE